MRRALLALWLLLPIAAWAYHEGPGQERLRADEVDGHVLLATVAAADEDWEMAIAGYEDALSAMPAEVPASTERRIRLELAKAKMQHELLPDAHRDLGMLVDGMVEDGDADPELLDEARSSLANAQYYMTWLMRLEGQPREIWEPEIEAARQLNRLVAENALERGDSAGVEKAKQDLEASVRLARMDIEELQGLPLPCQCNCCGSCNGKGNKKKRGRGKGKGQKKGPKDARGASAGPPADGGGS